LETTHDRKAEHLLADAARDVRRGRAALVKKSSTLREQFLAFDQRLASHGVPPLTAWWREGIGRWLDAYEQGTILELWACVGRGSSKSTALYKLALFFALFGAFEIPPGERHYAIILSRLVSEAAKGISIISRWLTLLRVKHRVVGDVVELDAMPRGIRVVAASVAATSGWRAFAVFKDERSKWPMAGVEEREADEIDTSAAAMTATHRAPIVSFGSAWSAFSSWHEVIAAGSDARRIVLGPTPTWIAAPHLREEDLRLKERNPQRFAREYGSVAQNVVWEDGFYDGLALPCVGLYVKREYDPRRKYKVALDPAFARDLFAICVAHAESDQIVVDYVEAIAPPRSGLGLSPTACLRRVRQINTEYRAGSALTDQHHAASLVDLGSREGVKLEPVPWTPASKAERYELTRVLMRDKKVTLPNDKPLLRELSGIGTKLNASGYESIQARPGFTDDRVSALVLAVSTLAARGHAGRFVDVLRGITPGELNARMIEIQKMKKFGLW
jgi:hypothetical protein